MKTLFTEYKKETSLLLLIFIGLLVTLMFCDSILLDELEHLRASYFVSLGDAPYRDFFEHHHPFIWYLLAPFMKILPLSNIVALYFAKTLSFITSCGSTYIVYRLTTRFFGGTKVALWCLLLYFFYFPSWYMFSIVKPDTYSRFFFLLGVYLFFAYTEKFERKNLVWCAISFTVSFLFLQTSLFFILPLAAPLLYLCIRNKKVVVDCLISAIIPLISLSVFALAYYVCGIWEPYFESNWIFNSYLFGILHTANSLPMFSLQITAGFLALFYLLWKRKINFYIGTIAIMFVFETIFRIMLPPPYPHYLVILFLYSSILISLCLAELDKKPIYVCVYVILFIDTLINFAYIGVTNNNESMKYLHEYNTNPQAKTVVFDAQFMSIYAPRDSYYWFYPNFCYADNAIFQRLPDFDINEYIINDKPVYIAYQYGTQPHFNWERVRKKYIVHEEYLPQHNLRTELLNDYYEILPNLYKRKASVDQ